MLDYRCPLDGKLLRPIRYEGVTIHTCDACGGELVTPAAMVQIIYAREEAFNADLLRELERLAPQAGIPDDARERGLECPCCQMPMAAINYANDSGVIVERCATCGAMWLDHEELEKSQALLERWQDEAPERIAAIAGRLEDARRQAEANAGGKFAGSRFSFVNAMINRLLDAA